MMNVSDLSAGIKVEEQNYNNKIYLLIKLKRELLNIFIKYKIFFLNSKQFFFLCNVYYTEPRGVAFMKQSKSIYKIYSNMKLQ